MFAAERSLRTVHASTPEAGLELEPEDRPTLQGFGPGDVLLTATILLVGLLPFLCDRLGVGQWSAGTLGFASVGAVLAARELFALARHRVGGGSSPQR
jgi:hypothetical protein